MTRNIEISRGALRAAVLSIAAIVGASGVPAAGTPLAPAEAHAVVGRPLTPVSYAGVARRSSRRVARRTVARTTPAVTSLPPGCVPTGATYTCGTARYEQVIDGGNVVYVVAE